MCSPKNAYNLFSQQKYTLFGGLQTWTIEKYFCGTSTKKYWTLVGTVTKYTKYSQIWKLCLWHPFNDNQTYFIYSNNQIWKFLCWSKHSCPLVSEGDWFYDPSQEKQSSGTHNFSRPRPDVSSFAWQSKEAILLYFTPPKTLTIPLYFKSSLVTNNTKFNVRATSVAL